MWYFLLLGGRGAKLIKQLDIIGTLPSSKIKAGSIALAPTS